MYLLDTNVLSEIRKIGAGRADPGVTAWAAMMDVREAFLSVVTIMELRRGMLSLARRDQEQATRIGAWLERDVIKVFRERILGTDLDTALICAKLHVGGRRPDNDAWIAATAIQHGLTVVTRNVVDFESLAVPLFNPFAPA